MHYSDLWYLSGYIQKESFFQAQIKSVGIQKTKYLERYNKNLGGSKRSSMWINLFSSLFLLFYAVFPILSLVNLAHTEVSKTTINDQLFSNGLIFGSYFLIVFVYYFLIGFLAMMEFLTGNTFKYLRTLPLESSDIRKITVFTIIRMNGMQLVVIILSIPIAILVLLKSIFLVFILLLINILNAIFIFYTFIVLSNFLSKNVFNNAKSSKLYTFIRLLVSVMYIISLFSISYIFQFIPYLLQSSILSTYVGHNLSESVNIIASLILFPVTVGYIVSLVIFPINIIPMSIIVSSIFGIILFIYISLSLLRKGNKILAELTYEDSRSTFKENKQKVDPSMVKIKVSTPRMAYIKRTLIMASREQGKLIVFLLPIFFPIISAFSFRNTSATGSLLPDPFFGLFVYFSFIPFILNNGLVEAEEGLGGLISTLPIKNRDIFRAKHIIMAALLLISAFIYTLIIGISYSIQFYDSIIKVIFLSLLIPNLNLLMFSIFFGRINGQSTLFKVNTTNSMVKYVIMGALQILMILIIVGGSNLLYDVLALNTITFSVFLLLFNVILMIFLDFLTRILIRS